MQTLQAVVRASQNLEKMATATLTSREIPPERAPEPPVEANPQMELVYTGNTGNDMGIGTMGFRSAKYNPSEWHEGNYAKYYQSFVDRDQAERVRHESKRTRNETEATTNNTQADVTKKLAERCKDIDFWKSELAREIRDVIDETDLLLAQKKRLENALRATEIPLHIATDNLNCRQRRQGQDLVQDDVEISLLKVSVCAACHGGSACLFAQSHMLSILLVALFEALKFLLKEQKPKKKKKRKKPN